MQIKKEKFYDTTLIKNIGGTLFTHDSTGELCVSQEMFNNAVPVLK